MYIITVLWDGIYTIVCTMYESYSVEVGLLLFFFLLGGNKNIFWEQKK